MAPDREDLTPALSEAKQRRATLHEALVALEVAISSPAAGRIPDWTALVAKEVTSVRDAFDQHVFVTEKPGGFPAAEALRYLRQHGIEATPRALQRHGSTEQTLAAAVAESGCGLLVLGAYGRSRLREFLFGGVTRHFLEDGAAPALLMAH